MLRLLKKQTRERPNRHQNPFVYDHVGNEVEVEVIDKDS